MIPRSRTFRIGAIIAAVGLIGGAAVGQASAMPMDRAPAAVTAAATDVTAATPVAWKPRRSMGPGAGGVVVPSTVAATPVAWKPRRLMDPGLGKRAFAVDAAPQIVLAAF